MSILIYLWEIEKYALKMHVHSRIPYIIMHYIVTNVLIELYYIPSIIKTEIEEKTVKGFWRAWFSYVVANIVYIHIITITTIS